MLNDLIHNVICQVGDEQQNTRIGVGTLSRSSVVANVNSQGDGVMSEMARRLQERRAKTDQVSLSTNNVCTCCVLWSVMEVICCKWCENML